MHRRFASRGFQNASLMCGRVTRSPLPVLRRVLAAELPRRLGMRRRPEAEALPARCILESGEPRVWTEAPVVPGETRPDEDLGEASTIGQVDVRHEPTVAVTRASAKPDVARRDEAPGHVPARAPIILTPF